MSSLRARLQSGASSLAGRAWAWVLAYVLLYLLLDGVSYIHPMRGTNITPWNPQTALAVALVVWKPQGWWLVIACNTWGDLLVQGRPLAWTAQLTAAALSSAGCIVTGLGLRRVLPGGTRLANRRDFVLLLAVASTGALLGATLYVGTLAAFGIHAADGLLAAVYRGWVGDVVGILVTLPILFVLGSRERRAATGAALRTVECWVVAGVAIVCAQLVFGRGVDEQFKFFYLLFLPVVWGAARFGVIGAVWSAALVQLLIVASVQSLAYKPLTVFELQALMAALAATGLLLGTTVDEREEAAQALQASLHFVAAGDMAAALAHELNQPLTAVRTYAKASQLMAQRLQPQTGDPLADVTGKLVAEVDRASDVVKRLRDFFRERATSLQPTAVEWLVDDAMQSHAAHAAARGIRLDKAVDPGLPTVWVDRVQILVALRNLIANALEAVGTQAQDAPRVEVIVRTEPGRVTIAVLDSGRGVAPEHLAHLFDSRRSSKPGGMGIGLGISRSIVQAHGGRLWAEPGPGGRFFLSLPVPRTPQQGGPAA